MVFEVKCVGVSHRTQGDFLLEQVWPDDLWTQHIGEATQHTDTCFPASLKAMIHHFLVLQVDFLHHPAAEQEQFEGPADAVS